MSKRRWPRGGTQCAILLDGLLRGERLSVLTALDKHGCYSLSQSMGELERMGWRLQKFWLRLPSGKRIMVFAL